MESGIPSFSLTLVRQSEEKTRLSIMVPTKMMITENYLEKSYQEKFQYDNDIRNLIKRSSRMFQVRSKILEVQCASTLWTIQAAGYPVFAANWVHSARCRQGALIRRDLSDQRVVMDFQCNDVYGKSLNHFEPLIEPMIKPAIFYYLVSDLILVNLTYFTKR